MTAEVLGYIMNEVFFTSDEHHYHTHVIRYNSRPFTSVEEMNSCLIKNHNSVVGKGDRVYHLGDFAWKYPEIILPELNGQHFLIKGNHDDIKKATKAGFIWVKDVFGLKVNDLYFWLSHYAHRYWNKSHYGSYHLYGHSHGCAEDNWGRSTDVGVDCWDYKPVHIDQIIEKLKDREWKDHHENGINI